MACARCYQQPHIKDCLGCGTPPTDEDAANRIMWRQDPDNPGEIMSPAEAHERGLPAYEALGFGSTLLDWDCCPLWYVQTPEHAEFREGDKSTVSGLPTQSAISRAYAYREKSELSSLYPPPWTPGFLSLLTAYSNLECEQVQLDNERRRREAERDRKNKARNR